MTAEEHRAQLEWELARERAKTARVEAELAAQRETLRSLKLGKIDSTNEVKDSPEIRGMLHRVRHLIQVSES